MTFHIGKDFFLDTNKVVCLVPYNTSRIKEEIQFKKNMELGMRDGTLIDATRGGKISSVVICMGGFYVLSCINSETLAKRFNQAVSIS